MMARDSATRARLAGADLEERFASIHELQGSDQPSPNVWKRSRTCSTAPAASASPREAAMLDKLRRGLAVARRGLARRIGQRAAVVSA